MGQNINKRKNIGVVGGGIIGLTCATILSEEYNVTLIADKIGIESDSRKATAIWHVYLVPETEQVLKWASHTLKILCEQIRNDPASGMELIQGTELFRNSKFGVPSWSNIPPYFKFLSQDEISSYNNYDELDLSDLEIAVLRKNPVRWGYHIQAPAVNMDTYLLWLQNNLINKGVKIVDKKLLSLEDVHEGHDVLINCTGFGARELVDDTNFEIYKGQYFVLRNRENNKVDYVGDDDHPGGMAYMIPRSGEILIGGCAEKNIEDLILTLDWNDTLNRASLYVPWLKKYSINDQVKDPVIGIRPSRLNGVRLEIDINSYSIPVIHNYGHGGSGFSLSWGCAQTVYDLVRTI